MTVFDLQNQLRTTGAYETPAEVRRPPLPVWLASPIFHLRLVGIFIRGHYLAKDPEFEKVEWAKFCFRMMRLTESLGGVISVSGFEHVRHQRFPVVWVSNHISPLETYLLPQMLTAFSGLMVILKESLAHYPLFGRIVRSVHPIRVQRRSAVEDLRKVLSEGVQGIHQGRSILVFPQGQRLPVFDPAMFNTMGVKVAQRAGVPIVPIAVRTDFLQRGRLHKDMVSAHPRRPVKIACGEPISPDCSPAEMHQAAIAFIASKLTEWERETETRLLASPAPA